MQLNSSRYYSFGATNPSAWSTSSPLKNLFLCSDKYFLAFSSIIFNLFSLISVVWWATHFDQASFEIDKQLPDVAVIDVKLDKGDKDGIDLLKKIKKITDLVPVIMISGHANVEMAVESLKLGAYEFITKPFATEQLLNFIKQVWSFI